VRSAEKKKDPATSGFLSFVIIVKVVSERLGRSLICKIN